MDHLRLEGVDFAYGTRRVLAGLSLAARAGERLVVLGPSGSGKTTILRLAAGLEAPARGRVVLHDRVASAEGRIDLAPAERRVALVFQDLALWPHLSADEQLRFLAPALDAAERRRLLRDVGLEGLADRLPGAMSGGERQRLALARALAARPELLLLDEPFANLDPTLRVELRRLLLALQSERGATTIYVTHDLDDAFALADRIAVLHAGRVEQVGEPEEVYRRPASAFVATFVGKAAVLPGRIDGGRVESPLGAFENPRPELRGRTVAVVVRPEDVEPGSGPVPARVDDVVFAGDRYLVRATTEAGPVWFYAARPPGPGEAIRLGARRGWPLGPEEEDPDA